MSKYDFMREYPGPLGRHLNCLTEFTKTRDESKRGGESIHPRCYKGRTIHSKANTMRRANPATRSRVIAGLSAHGNRHPNDRVSAVRLAKLSTAIA